jgi:hypothetical protein
MPMGLWESSLSTRPRESAYSYKWRAKYGDMDAYMIRQMKTREGENQRQTNHLSMQINLRKEAP